MLLYQRKWIIFRILQLCGNCCFPWLLFSCLGRSKHWKLRKSLPQESALCPPHEQSCPLLEPAFSNHTGTSTALGKATGVVCASLPDLRALLAAGLGWHRRGHLACAGVAVIGTLGKAVFKQHLDHGWCPAWALRHPNSFLWVVWFLVKLSFEGLTFLPCVRSRTWNFEVISCHHCLLHPVCYPRYFLLGNIKKAVVGFKNTS